MKHFIGICLIGATLMLTACNSTEETSAFGVELGATESEHIEQATADLSEADFDAAIQRAIEEDDLFVAGATYEAYLLTQADLSKTHFEKAKEQDIFAAAVTYADYEKLAEAVVNLEQFEKTMLADQGDYDEEFAKMAYGSYVAKLVQSTMTKSQIGGKSLY